MTLFKSDPSLKSPGWPGEPGSWLPSSEIAIASIATVGSESTGGFEEIVGEPPPQLSSKSKKIAKAAMVARSVFPDLCAWLNLSASGPEVLLFWVL